MALSDNNKWLIAGISVALLALVGGAWFFLSPKKAELRQSLPSSSDGILSISNADNANLVILTAQIDNVIVDIQGPATEVGKTRFYSDAPPNSKFDLPDDWGGLSGTITVPKGTLVELKPSKNTPVTITDKNGERAGAAGRPLLVDTTNLTKITTGKSNIGIEGSGTTDVEDETLAPPDDLGGSGTGSGPTSCGFGAQLLRNRCCVRQNANAPKPSSCPGQWVYDNTVHRCEYECAPQDQPGDNFDETYGGEGGDNGLSGGDTGIPPNPGAKPVDPTSQQCIRYIGAERSQCCDERLRNPLRIGPRPGFPDCIGTWIFDPQILNCKFQCADYGQMIQILNELKSHEIPQ